MNRKKTANRKIDLKNILQQSIKFQTKNVNYLFIFKQGVVQI